MVNQAKLEEVRKIILSLLLARKGATPVTVLERDYYEMEQTRIPCCQFGHADVVGFLQSMPEYFIVEQNNGGHYVRGIASEKSKHVSSLVSRQKIDQKLRHPPSSYLRQHQFNRRIPHMKSQRVRIAPDKLFYLMQHIKSHPNGVSIQNALLFVQRQVPFIEVSAHDLQEQLRELQHQLFINGNMIYPMWNNGIMQANIVHQQPSPLEPSVSELQNSSEPQSKSESPPATQTICAAGYEESDWMEACSNESDFMTAGCSSAGNCQRRVKTSEHLAANLAQYAKCEQTDTMNYNKVNNDDMENDDEYFAMMHSRSNGKMTSGEYPNISEIISDRTKSRLEQLLQKHPEGIWCAELPDIYLQEYKVRLNYTGLGFASVREFTSQLPKIFYMTQVNKTDDFILYSADRRPTVPQTEPIEMTQASYKRYDEYSTVQTQYSNDEDDAPIPSDVSPTITKRFAPNDVMNYNDKVPEISVSELLKRTKSHLEVYVIEIFNPNFFWIHLRENKKRLDRMMDDLSLFYQQNKEMYNIAKIALKKGLNCACMYAGTWNRGIIKSVNPDFRAKVFFYDYGTLKAYEPEDIYYLHEKFSYLPAQAIPCGLYNVKPIVGDRWKRTVTNQFNDKVADTVLAASIKTIDPTYNSMMVILTDVSEEEDVHINDWLLKEKLARVGKTVRIYELVDYLSSDNDTESSTSDETFDAGNVVDVNETRHYKDRSTSRDERTHRLSDIKSENIGKKTVKSLHNVPASKKALLQMLWSKSPDVKSSHAKSPSAKSSDVKSPDAKSQSRTPRELAPLLEKLKTLSHEFNSNASTSEANGNNEDNARQIDPGRTIESQDRNKDHDYYEYMTFSPRDSDDENDEKDFGTFRSLYGGNGFMEPFDWSVIRENDHPPRRTTSTLSNNLDMSIRECESDVVEDKSKSHNHTNDIPGKQYFLDMTRMEKENFLPENNIDYDIENMSELREKLKHRVILNHTITVMFAPNNKLGTLRDSVQSEDTSNFNANIIELNDVASSRRMDQEVDKSNKVCETKADKKIENRDSNADSNVDSNTDSDVDSKTDSNADSKTDSNADSETNFNADLKLVFSNMPNNKDNMNREMSECNTNSSLGSNANDKVYNPRYKTLLDKMKRRQMNTISSDSINARESASSEQIQSSSYGCSISGNTITSSNNRQPKTSNPIDKNTRIKILSLVKELESTSKELLKNLALDELHSDSEGTKPLSSLGTDSIASSNNDAEQHRLSQSLETDSTVSSNVDDTKQGRLSRFSETDSIASSYNNNDYPKYQPNVTDQTLGVPKIVQQMLKIVQNIASNTELDSDDLSSNQESVKDDKSDESKGDNKSVKSLDCMSETRESVNDDANATEIVSFQPLVYNDCDVESDDSVWDAYAGEEFPFYIAQPPKQGAQLIEI